MEFLEACFRRMPRGKRIAYYRSDSAAYQAGVINLCLEHKTLFTITADKDKAVKEAIKSKKEEEWQHLRKQGEVVSLHNQRGQVENYIKELKEGFGMNWMPCGETYANAVFFRIGVLDYNLFVAMKLLALPRWYSTFTISTIRWRLYKVAGEVVTHTRQILLKLVAPMDKISLLHKFRLRCFRIACG